jgi:hypothetical protein
VTGAVVVAAVAVSLFLLVARPLSHASSAAETTAQASASLQSRTRGRELAVVPVRQAFEAVAYDQYGHLGFWSDASGSWVLQASRTYQTVDADYSGQDVTVTGLLLPEMSDATFLVHSQGFSGDGSGDADVYARGASGWGDVIQKGLNLMPTGRSAGVQGAFLDAWLSTASGLQTAVESGALGNSGAPLIDDWKWTDGRFALSANNTVTATLEASPKASAPALPWETPRTGTYGVILGGAVFAAPLPGEAQPVVVMYVQPTALTAECVDIDGCQPSTFNGFVPTLRYTIGGNLRSDYGVTTTAESAYIHGPAWFLAVIGPNPNGDDADFMAGRISPYPVLPAYPASVLQGGSPGDYSTAGSAPWYIPSTLDVQSFNIIKGYAQLTFENGEIVHMTVF